MTQAEHTHATPAHAAAERAPADSFVLARDRDAWATIRGFVYQVDLTILRWIGLGPDQVLLLEHGEDIDVVTGALAAAPDDQARVLEQVKVRASALTLRSAAVRGALANFFEHRRANPGHRLSFRFTTTATPGLEHGASLPAGLRGIDGWRLVQTGQLSGEPADAVRAAIRALLHGADRPADVPEPLWADYQAWLANASASEFGDFVAGVEWAIASPDLPSLRRELLGALTAAGLATSDGHAQVAYERLFAAVFTRLSTRGVKRVDAADLRATLADPTDAERAAVILLRGLHDALAGRVSALEHRMSEVEDIVAVATEQIHTLAARADVLTTVTFADVVAPAVEEPPLAVRGTEREETVGVLLEGVSGAALVILHGPQASGKTQLARAVARRLGARRVWVRLGAAPPAVAAERLIRAVQAISATAGARGDASTWESVTAALVVAADVLVLDDVPLFRDGDPLGQRLIPLLGRCVAAGVSAVLTGVRPLTPLERAVDTGALVARPVPPMTEGEVREILTAYGAPEHVVEGRLVQLVSGLTAGHPVLLQAVARFLAARQWRMTEQVLHDLFRGRFADPVSRETAQAILAEVSDPEARDLLYRLTIADGALDDADVAALVEVPPPVTRGHERFMTLLGPWVQEVAPGRFEVSPLVKALGAPDLPIATRRACHLTLARRLLSVRRLGADQVIRVMGHFTAGGDAESAGLVLLQALHALYTLESPARGRAASPAVATSARAASQLWLSVSVPEDLSAVLRLQVRTFQALLARRYGAEPRRYIDEVETILASADIPASHELMASALLATEFALHDVRVASHFMQRALRTWGARTDAGLAPAADGPARRVERNGERGELPPGAPRNGSGAPPSDAAVPALRVAADLPLLAILCAGGVRDGRDLDLWLTALEGLPTTVRNEVAVAADATEILPTVVTGVVMRAYESKAPDRWVRAASVLEALAVRAAAIGATALARAARAALLTAMVEGGAYPARVDEVARALMAEFDGDPNSQLLVAKHAGLALLDAGERALGVAWLERGADTPGDRHAPERLHVALRLAQRVVDGEPERAVRLAESAVARALRPGAAAPAGSPAADDGPAGVGSAPSAPGAHVADDALPTRHDGGGTPADTEADAGHHGEPALEPSGVHPFLRLQALGERAVIYWAAGRRREAGRAMLDALEELFAVRDDGDQNWRCIAVVMGHASGYFVSMLTTGNAPDAVAVTGADGSVAEEPYSEPKPGLFVSVNLELGALYDSRKTAVLMAQVALLADAVGSEERAERWAERAADAAKAEGLWMAAVVPLGLLTRQAVRRGDFAGAIVHATDAAGAWWVIRESGEAALRGSIFDPTPGPAAITSASDGGDTAWREVDALVTAEVVLTGLLSVANLWVASADGWRERLAALRAACDAQASSVRRPDTWAKAVEVCDLWLVALSRAASADDLRVSVTALAADDHLRALHVAGLLGASFAADASLIQALSWQLSAGPYLEARLGRDEETYERLVLDVLEGYWRRAFEQARFRFSTPGLVESRLATLRDGPRKRRLRRLFDVIAAGLGVRLPDSVARWVYDG